MRRYTKEEITFAIKGQLPSDYLFIDKTIGDLQSLWFVTRRSNSGFQLTELGHGAFNLAEVEYEDKLIDSKTSIYSTSFKIQLSKKIPCPYYLYGKNEKYYIRLYDGRISSWIDLAGGIAEYLARE